MDARARDPDPTPPVLSVDTVLARLAAELADLGECADGLQAVIGGLVAAAAIPPSGAVRARLQAADALSQRLERAARIAALLQAGAPAGWTVDATQAPGLGSLLARLTPPAPDATHDEGDCELF